MMKKYYCIFDRKVGNYVRPFTAASDQDALRIAQTAVNDDNTLIGQYPEDYELHKTNEFDDTTGVFAREEHTTFMAQCASLVRVVKPSEKRTGEEYNNAKL